MTKAIAVGLAVLYNGIMPWLMTDIAFFVFFALSVYDAAGVFFSASSIFIGYLLRISRLRAIGESLVLWYFKVHYGNR